MKKIILSMCILLGISTGSTYGSDLDKYLKKEYISPRGDTLRYRVLEPEKLDKGKKYPLVLFLHGSGERGNNNEAQLIHGGNMFLNPVVREEYPAFVLFPQCPENQSWYNNRASNIEGKFAGERYPEDPEITTPMQSVKELLDVYLKRDDVDTNRIYVMGLSMGGMGTFDMLCRFPHLFAAAIPICGGVNPTRLEKAAPTASISIYHGDKDTSVVVENSREAYRALRRAGQTPKYHEFPGCGHNSWDPAYNQPDFMSWLFSQSR